MNNSPYDNGEKIHPVYAAGEESQNEEGRRVLEGETSNTNTLKHQHDNGPYYQPRQETEREEARVDEMACSHFYITFYVIGHMIMLMALYLTFNGVFMYAIRRVNKSLKIVELNPNGLDGGEEI